MIAVTIALILSGAYEDFDNENYSYIRDYRVLDEIQKSIYTNAEVNLGFLFHWWRLLTLEQRNIESIDIIHRRRPDVATKDYEIIF